MNTKFHSSILSIQPETWNRLCGHTYPFLRHEFLLALEAAGCTSENSGWVPYHMSLEAEGRMLAVMPLYLKHHSYGEYVFDWSWADAYHRHGLNYYPKLLNAIPFTPATGPRMGVDPTTSIDELLPEIVRGLNQECLENGFSSWHCLFPDKNVSNQLQDKKILQREGHQYHWINNNYRDFDDFLNSFTSRKRKNLRKERKRVKEQGIELIIKSGKEVTDEEWDLFYQFYHFTYFKRSGRQGYLNREFFQKISESIDDCITMVIAKKNNSMVAGSLLFEDSTTLYGRYWGCSEEYDFLHFEACYYQGIEYAIKKGLSRFDPGAQGEHKIQRGFTPIATYSNHWIAREDFGEAITRFLVEEKTHNQEYLKEAKKLLPFKQV